MSKSMGATAAVMIGVLWVGGALTRVRAETHDFRDRQGRRLTAEVIEVGEDSVTLRTKEGIKVVSLAAFSDADRAYLRKLLKSRQVPKEAAPPDTVVDMERVLDIAFSPDGKYIAAATIYGKTKAAIWQADNGELVNTLRDVSRLARGLNTIAFSPTSTAVATGTWQEGLVALLGVPKGVEILKLVHTVSGSFQPKNRPPELHSIRDVAFSPDGTRLVVGTGHDHRQGELFVWDTRSGKSLYHGRVGERDAVHSVAVSGDGRFIACPGPREGGTGSVIVWNAATMEQRHVLRGNKAAYESICALAFSPTEPLVAAGVKTRIILWNAETGDEVRSIGASVPYSLEFSSDGKRLVSGSRAQGVAVYDVGTGREVWRAKDPPDLTAQVNAVAFHPDRRRVAAGTQDGRVICWDTEANEVLWTMHGRR